MEDTAASIEILNQVLHKEFVAILQYFLHAKLLADSGLHALAKKMKDTSIGEMHHADALIERILFLNGRPIIGNVTGINVAFDIENMLKNDLRLEEEAIKYLQKSIREIKEDIGTEELLREILKAEEEHVDWLDQQLSLIKLIGVEKYLEKNG